jgi:hypothetical protein
MSEKNNSRGRHELSNENGFMFLAIRAIVDDEDVQNVLGCQSLEELDYIGTRIPIENYECGPHGLNLPIEISSL